MKYELKCQYSFYPSGCLRKWRVAQLFQRSNILNWSNEVLPEEGERLYAGHPGLYGPVTFYTSEWLRSPSSDLLHFTECDHVWFVRHFFDGSPRRTFLPNYLLRACFQMALRFFWSPQAYRISSLRPCSITSMYKECNDAFTGVGKGAKSSTSNSTNAVMNADSLVGLAPKGS